MFATRKFFLVVLLLCLAAGVAAQQLTITTTTLPPVLTGRFYITQLQAVGGLPPYEWQVVGGTLPEGISLTPQGQLVGQTNMIGTFQFTVRVRDKNFQQQFLNFERRFQ